MDVTDGPVFLLLRARTRRRRLLPDAHAKGCVTVQLRQLLLGHLKDAELLDSNGNRFRIVDASFKRIDFASYRPHGLTWGIILLVIGALTLTCFVKVAVRLDHVKTLPLEETKEWLIDIVNESPNFYQHALQEELVARISKTKSLKNLISRWYFV